MLKNYDEIFEKQSEGLCESCDYGFDQCIRDGRAACTIKDEVKSDGKENTV